MSKRRGRLLFVKKKEAKKFSISAVLVSLPPAQTGKSFWRCFFLKKRLLSVSLKPSALMRVAFGALAALTLLRLILAATMPLTPDETYYFLWSQHLQAGYYDAPSMVAVWIQIGTLLLGNDPLGVRLLGPISAGLGTLLLMDAGERMFPHRQAGLMAGAMLNATLMIGAGSIIMTPDTPLIFFWTAGIAAFARLLEHDNPRWWLAIGVAAGLALYAKYTAALFIAAAFIWMISDARGRAQLRTPWPWAAILIALAIFAPNLWWNGAHGWVSYLKQGGRVAHFQPARALQFFGEFLGGQIALFTPIIFGLAAWGTWRLGRSPSAAAHLLVWMTVVPGVVFLEHVISGRVQPQLGGDHLSLRLPGRRFPADGGSAPLAETGAGAGLRPDRHRLCPGPGRALSAARQRRPHRPADARLRRARGPGRGAASGLPHLGRLRHRRHSRLLRAQIHQGGRVRPALALFRLS